MRLGYRTSFISARDILARRGVAVDAPPPAAARGRLRDPLADVAGVKADAGGVT